jgi:lysophospholipase L1-like esterase
MIAARAKSLYVFLAVTWFSSCALLLLVVASTSLFFRIRDRRQIVWWFNPAALTTLNGREADELFESFYQVERNQYQYQPWVGFSERVFHSRLVNIDAGYPLPIRRTSASRTAARARTKRVVWLFGGSTTFGIGVPDNLTIASQLSAILARREPEVDFEIINHGHCDFYSSQELALLQWLLRSGQRADVAIFLDGLNETAPMSQKDLPAFADLERQMFEHVRRPLVFSPWFAPVRFIHGLQRRAAPANVASTTVFDVSRIVQTYGFNVRAARSTASAAGIEALFFWQPTAFDSLDSTNESIPLRQIRSGRAQPSQGQIQDLVPIRARAPAFKKLNAEIRTLQEKLGVASIAALFQGASFKNIYVDSVHYGDAGSRAIAEQIAQRLLEDESAASISTRRTDR